MEAQLLQELILPIIASLAGTAFTAAQATKWYQRVIAGREQRIASYIEIGVRFAYQTYVRAKKKENGKLSERDANTARNTALKAAGKEAQRNNDTKILENLSDAELNARLESTLQAIKADAAAGVPVALEKPKPFLPPLGMIAIMIGLAPVFLSGCLGLTPGLEPPANGPSYEQAAIQAWAVWSISRMAGDLPEFDATGLSEEEEAEVAFRYTAAVVAYAVANIQSRTPRPSIPATLVEANNIGAWYLREAWPNVQITWSQLQTKMQQNGVDAGRLAPLFTG